MESGDTIHDVIRFVGPRVKMIGTGWVASAGAHIFLGAEKENRFCLPNTRFLLHQPLGGVRGQASDISIEAEEIIKMRERINREIAPETGQPYEQDRSRYRAQFLDGRGRGDSVRTGLARREQGRRSVSGATPWWRGAVIYQIYVRSFCDSNGDGQGDLPGVIAKLDYLAALGVDAIWLSPIHPSPNRDWGYDVSDYDGIHPDYGTQADFDQLLAAAHARGLKVITDEVLAHTSDEHAWFLDSLKKGDKSDWYVWADPRRRRHGAEQLAVGFRRAGVGVSAGAAAVLPPQIPAPAAQAELAQCRTRKAAALAVLDHWLERGVDGFRLDVANAYLHDAALADNPPVPMAERNAHSWAHAPNLQFHYHDSNLAENIEVLDEIRRTVDRYPNRFVMGEFSEEAGALAAAMRPPTRACTPATAFRCWRPTSWRPNSSSSISPCWRSTRTIGRRSRSATTTSCARSPASAARTRRRDWPR